MVKNNKGITLIAVIVTIVILLIIAGVTITGAIRGVDESKDNTLLTELEISILQKAKSMEVTGKIPSAKQANKIISARERMIGEGMPLQF